MKRTFIALIVIFLIFFIPTSHAQQTYPTVNDHNEESILDEVIWAKFIDIDGFSNQPNASTSSTVIRVELAHPNGTFEITLDPVNISDYKNFDNTGKIVYSDEVVLEFTYINGNQTNTTRIGVIKLNGYTGSRHHLTATVDDDGNVDIFWMRAYVVPELPEKYHLFYSRIDVEGNVTESNTLFYFETRIDDGSLSPETEMIYFYIGLVLTIIGVLVFKYYRASKK